MNLLYSTLAALAVLGAFVVLIWRQNRDLLRARAHRDFFLRLIPPLSTGVFVVGLPLVLRLATTENYGAVLLVYLGGAAALTAIISRSVAPEERRAVSAFRKGDYEQAAAIYEELISRRPLARHYSALAACMDAAGNPHAALEAAEHAIKLDPKLGIAYYNRASALAALGENRRARSDLEMVFRTDSNRRLRRAAEAALRSLEEKG